MEQNNKENKFIIIGIIAFLLPLMSFALLNFVGNKRPSPLLSDLLTLYIILCLVFPCVYGITMLSIRIKNKSGVLTIISILNAVSPIWLCCILLIIIFSQNSNNYMFMFK